MSRSDSVTGVSRRDFLRWSGCALGGGVALWTLRPRAEQAVVRPAGALPEAEFRASCLRCGRCASACDMGAIRLGADGLPYVDGLRGWCDFCMACAEACPAGALQPVEPEAARLGTGIIDRERCIAWNWPGCRLCFEVCTALQRAVWLDDEMRPHVDEARCNGCGACVFVCPQSADPDADRRYGKAVSLHGGERQ